MASTIICVVVYPLGRALVFAGSGQGYMLFPLRNSSGFQVGSVISPLFFVEFQSFANHIPYCTSVIIWHSLPTSWVRMSLNVSMSCCLPSPCWRVWCSWFWGSKVQLVFRLSSVAHQQHICNHSGRCSTHTHQYRRIRFGYRDSFQNKRSPLSFASVDVPIHMDSWRRLYPRPCIWHLRRYSAEL